MRRERWMRCKELFLLFTVIGVFTASSAYGEQVEETKRFETILQQQQDQIQTQQENIDRLQKQVEALQEEKTTGRSTAGDETTVKTKSKATVRIYGQVNKAVLYSDDGDDGNLYLVDNDNSSTRMGLTGTVIPNERYEIGSKIEVEFQSNDSNLVSRIERRDVGDNHFRKRHLDLWVDAMIYGKLSMGWGSTASDGTSEMDLSGTSVVGYSSIVDMAGGQLFYDKNTNRLSGTRISNVFTNMDGLGRDERIRYDTPTFNGFMGSASYIADGGGDIAIRYSARIDAFKVAAAAAFSNPGGTSDTVDEQLAGSVSVLHDTGFNGTFAMGTRDPKMDGRDDGTFFYTKFGYRANWCPMGVTSLSMDYCRSTDIDQDGDEADMIGFQMAQDLESWGAEAYVGYRFHSLDRNGTDYDNINAIMAGMRVKF